MTSTQRDTTWGPDGILAWTSWFFPIPLYVMFMSWDMIGSALLAKQSGKTYIVAGLYFGLFLFMLYLFVATIYRIIEGRRVAREVSRINGKIEVKWYFFGKSVFEIKEIITVKRVPLAKWRKYVSLLGIQRDKENIWNYKVCVKGKSAFYLNGDAFNPKELLK